MLLAFGAAVVGVILFARAHWNGLYDDAFIYLRYAKNVDRGCGVRWNCAGPAVEGTTGILYLGILAAGGLVTSELIALCQGVDTVALVVAVGAAAVLAGVLARERVSPWAAAALVLGTALVLVADDYVLLNAVNGMETALGAALVSALAVAAIAQRPRTLAALACAATLVRPEAALFVVALPLLPWMRRGRVLGACGGFLVACASVRYAYFGELAPNTFYAKSGGTWTHAALGLDYIVDCARDFPLSFAAPLALLGGAPQRRAVGYLLAVSAVWLAFFLRSGGDLFAYSRLWLPLVPALSACALAGIASSLWRRPRVAIAATLVVVALAGGRALVDHAIPPQHAAPRVVQWAAIGTYVRAHFPTQLIATVPIGAIGYYSNNPILDLVGLTEPAIARAGRSVPTELLTKTWIGHERNFTEYALAQAPAVIVTTEVRSIAWRELAEARAGFYADWLLVQEIKAGRAPYHVWDAELTPDEHVLMFVRDGITPR